VRAPISWVAEYVELPPGLKPQALAEALVRVGLEVERVFSAADGISGPIVLARVVSFVAEPQRNGKTIRWCQVDVGEGPPRGIVCGAANFAAGDLVVAALPGAVLPGPFVISARTTYGHVSDGMICSARELGLGEDHSGIMVLPDDAGSPGNNALAALGMTEAVLDIAVTPDRGYCLSVRGLAREAAAALGVAFHDVVVAVPPSTRPAYPVVVEAPQVCDQFSARVVTGLDPAAPTPEFMLRRLRACGMRSISLAVDVTNYVMLETGQPLHAFDRDRLSGSIVVRHAVTGEKLTTLDGVVRSLDSDDLAVTDDSGVLALAGVMGGASTEVRPNTSALVLEAAHWDPASVSRTVRRHRLPSEAAKRFERGVDPAIAATALQRCVDLLERYGSARSSDGFTVVGSGPSPVRIPLRQGHPGELAGMPIDPQTVRRLLIDVGCIVEDAAELIVTPPSWRPDLTDPADLVEEVLRLLGYDKIPSTLPTPPPGRGLTEPQRRRRAISRAMAGAGYCEVISYPFVAPSAHDAFGLAADDPRRNSLRLANPLSDAEPELRTSLLPTLLATASRNVGRGNRDLALFETGLVYLGRGSASSPGRPGVAHRPSAGELAAIEAALPDQPRHLAVVLTGRLEADGWWGPARAASWSDAVEAGRIVARAAGSRLQARSAQIAPWHPGRCAELLVGEVSVGTAGELHPRVTAVLGLPERTCAMELDLDALPPFQPVQAPALSAYPPVLLDVAVVMDAAVPAAELEAALRHGAGSLLESLRLFDVYVDAERLGPGLKSVAFACRFRAFDRTLTVEEATAARDAALAEAARRTGAVLRG
jgi:phenylalanyl-tRNA synthetase beta chain